MFKNLPTKQKMFLNMLLAQIGFAAITAVAIYSDSKISAILTVNILFAIIIAYSNYTAMKRVVGGIERFKIYMEDLLDFVYMRTNTIEKAKFMKNDEIGLLLKEMNNYVDIFDAMRKEDMKVMGEIVLVLDKMSKGIYECRINATSHNFMIKALKDMVNKMLDVTEHNMIDLKNTLESYSKDDFTKQVTIETTLRADMLKVMSSVNILGKSLSNAAKLNLSNGKTLEANADTMNISVSNLVNKANKQSLALDETTKAVEKITNITKDNTSNTTKMSNLGKTVQKAVSDGSFLAKKTSDEMDEINKQVIAINESISVIDQIAFQTNILSLNAAVEAATAGEAGKGFAVVAQEVRNLATRSAEAAKEIKELVEIASLRTKEGKKVSDDMIVGYEILNKHFNETINLIEEVNHSSEEQMSGIQQINDTVNELDTMTQENTQEASSVSDIASEVSTMANRLVSDASSKKFN